MIVGMVSKLDRGQRQLLGLSAVILAVLGLVWLPGYFRQKSFDAKLERAAAQGFPFSPNEIVEDLENQPGVNGAPYYDQLRQRKYAIPVTDREHGRELVTNLVGSDLTDEQWATLEQYLTELGQIFEEIEIGAASDYCYFQRDWADPAGYRFMEVLNIKEIARDLMARVAVNVRRNDWESVDADLKTILQNNRFLATQPSIIGVLGSIGSNLVMCQGIEFMLPIAAKSRKLRAIFRSTIESMPEAWDLTKPLQMEAFEQYWYIENVVAAGRMEEMFEYYSDYTDQPEGMRDAMGEKLAKGHSIFALKSAVLDVWASVLREYKPGQDERQLFEEATAREEQAMARSSIVEAYFMINAAVLGSLPDSLDRARATRRCMLAALAVLEFYADNGSWPVALPSSYIDPFDGEPLRYSHTPDGFRVWSIGPDGVDNLGVTREENEDESDLAVVYPPAAKPYVSQYDTFQELLKASN